VAAVQRWTGLDSVPSDLGPCVVSIGVFDGVHRGHRSILDRAVTAAHERGATSVVVTFDPHPAKVVGRPVPAMLGNLRRRAQLLGEVGIDRMFVLPFTREISEWTPEEFVERLLVDKLHVVHVVVGENFRFGHRAAGDIDLLTRLGRTFGFAVDSAPLVTADGTPFSSTYIRASVDAGEVRAAGQALGRPHRLEGVVVRGDQRGREIGFRTANLLCGRYTAIPADGVYACWLVRRGERLMAATSIGTNPTFNGRERRVEAYVLDFDGDLYGERLALDFVDRLREMRRYDGIDPLIAQIRQDVADTRTVLAG
jgi:riboflavin kinase/FMN adenylyltransferase